VVRPAALEKNERRRKKKKQQQQQAALLQQQRIEAELIAARLFRYKVRRGLGVFYALVAIMPVVGIVLYLTVPPLFVVFGLIAGYLTIWIVARMSGFAGMTRMQYSLDFLKGERGGVYDEKGYRWISWTKSFASFFLLIALPWLAYSVADQEGYTTLSSVIILALMASMLIIEMLSRQRRKKNNKEKSINVLERRVEDWAIIVGSFSIALLANAPGAPVWTWALASPIFLLSGIKSLYDAPKELALVAF
jgi:hypothetical protein